MKNTKILFFDIDGTLIDMNRKKISDKMLEALTRLKERGILLCLATGRGPKEVPVFPGVEFDAYLTYNGSYCFDGRQTIYSSPIPTEDVKRVIKNASGIGRPVSAATKDRLLANGSDKDLEDYYAISKAELIVAPDFDDVVNREAVYQLMVGCRESEYDSLMKDAPGAALTAWWDRAVDIIPAGGGKGLGIEKVLSYYGLTKEEAIAFGDGTNDIEMLQAVGTGIAMGNATENVKDIADAVCKSVSEDGIYHYCLDHKLI